MREATEEGFALIRRFEGFSPIIYQCPAGYDTIGYGHLVRPQERARFAGGIDEAGAELQLHQDVQDAELAVLRLVAVPLTDGQFDALVSFTFNFGAGALQRSTLRRKVNREEHAEVPVELRRWVWAGGRRLSGLVARRQAEAARYAAAERNEQAVASPLVKY
jgi:lysozyme